MNICKFCNQEFIITKYQTIFCNHTCQAKWAITIANKNKKPREKTGNNINCFVCSKEFYAPLYRIKLGKVKYCSRSCMAKELLPKYVKEFGFQSLNKPRHKYKTKYINGKQVRLHRYIMEQHLGRKLESWEHVHHINDDSNDNRLENLVVLSNSDHQKHECAFRKKIISYF